MTSRFPDRYAKEFLAGWGSMDFNGHLANTAYLDLAADVGIEVPHLTAPTHAKLSELMPESTMMLNPLDLGTRPLVERALVGKSYEIAAADSAVNMVMTRLFGNIDDVTSGITATASKLG